jgi:hypothetical protein
MLLYFLLVFMLLVRPGWVRIPVGAVFFSLAVIFTHMVLALIASFMNLGCTSSVLRCRTYYFYACSLLLPGGRTLMITPS